MNMKMALRRMAVALVLGTMTGFSHAVEVPIVQTNALDKLQTIYVNAVAQIDDDTERLRDDALTQYGKTLDAILASLKEKGDIDAFKIVYDIKQRFILDNTTIPKSSSVYVTQAAATYRKQILEAAANSNQRKAEILKKYISALNVLIKDLMMKDNIADADAVAEVRLAAENELQILNTSVRSIAEFKSSNSLSYTPHQQPRNALTKSKNISDQGGKSALKQIPVAEVGDVVVTDSAGKPVVNANVYLIHSGKKIFVNMTTDQNGKARFGPENNGFEVVYCAHTDFCAFRKKGHDPAKPVEITLQKKKDTGSIIVDRTGYIPGLLGRIAPIFDSSNRLYMYGDNISLNRGSHQPVYFQLGKPTRAEDAAGHIFDLTVEDVIGSTFLIEYKNRNGVAAPKGNIVPMGKREAVGVEAPGGPKVNAAVEKVFR